MTFPTALELRYRLDGTLDTALGLIDDNIHLLNIKRHQTGFTTACSPVFIINTKICNRQTKCHKMQKKPHGIPK